MTRRAGWVVACAVWAAAGGTGRAGADDAVPAADRAVVAARVAELGSGDPAVRDRAEFALQTVPSVDVPVVLAAAADPASVPADADAGRRLAALPAYLVRRVAVRRRQEAAAAERDDYLRAIGLKAYRGVPARNPKWDAEADRAVGLMCRTPVGIADADRLAADRRTTVGLALADGCDVAAFLFHAARCADDAGGVLVDAKGHPHTAADLWHRAQRATAGDGAEPYHKWLAARTVLSGTATGAYDVGPRQDRQVLADLAAAAVDGFDRATDAPPAVRVAMAGGLLDAVEDVNRHGMALFHFDEEQNVGPIVDRLGGLYPADPGVDVLRGRVLADWASRGRGGRAAKTPQQAQDGAVRLAAARAALDKAYAADPARPGAAAAVLGLLVEEESTRPELDQWYARASAADPDDPAAWQRAVEWLHPKRHGSADALLAFARGCADRGSWAGRQPLALVYAHRDLAAASVDPAAYYHKAGVWGEIANVYDGYFRRYPTDVAERSRYADLAAKCGRYAEAAATFKALGETVDLRPFSSAEVMRSVRAEANFRAKH